MAIAKMEKLTLTFKRERLDEVLHLMQEAQCIHIESNYESTIPQEVKADIVSKIRETEGILLEIQTASNILKGRKSAHMLSMFRGGGEKKLSSTELNKIVEQSGWQDIVRQITQTDRRLKDNRSRRHELARLLANLRIWDSLGSNPLEVREFERTSVYFGSVHSHHAYEFSATLEPYEEEGIVYERGAEIGDRVFFMLVCHIGMNEKLSACMSEFSFSPEEYPFDKPPAAAARELEAEEQRLLEEREEIETQIAKQEKYQDVVILAEDYNMNILLRQTKALEIAYKGEEIVVNGWIISAGRKQFEKLLSSALPDEDYSVDISEVKARDVDKVPIKLKNNKLVTVYEMLTEMYSLPRYNEVDPTPVLTVFYMIFFGMMISDLGYGFAVFLVGLLATRVIKVKRSTKRFIEFLYYLSFPSMAWGLVFGSFFGTSLPFRLLSFTVDIIPMSVIAIALGFFHIMTGLVLQMINQQKQGKTYELLTGGLAWFLTFLGCGVMIVTGLVPMFDIPPLFLTGLIITIAGLAITIFVPAIQYGKRWYAGIGKGLYSLYGAISYLGDFVSYTRLMALGVAGGSVALAFNTILSILPLPVRFTLGIALAVVLHGLNIVLSMLGAYVHGIRLQFIEFFGKFYTGGGKRFEPFKAAEKNIVLSGASED